MISLDSHGATSKSLERILLFLSNGITPEESIEEFRRVPLFNLLLFIGIIFFSFFSFYTAITGDYFYSAIEFTIASSLMISYFVTRRNGIPPWSGKLLLSVFYVFFILLGINGGPGGTGYVWVYTFPLAATFLSGPGIGTLWAASLLGIILTVSLSFSSHPFIMSYSVPQLLRLSTSYLVLLIFSFMSDGILIYTYRKMKEMRSELEKTIAELNQSREELHQQAMHDGLTGVYNRRFFNQTITTWTIQAQRHRSATALFMIDVDYFKRYNDRFGHLKGDNVLKSVADAITHSLRRESDMVFRYGGEEFTVLLTKTTSETTQRLAQKIMNNIRRCNIPHPDSATGFISVSIGITEWNPQERELFPEEFIQKADDALYRAKRCGRNTIRHHDVAEDDFGEFEENSERYYEADQGSLSLQV